YIMCLFVLVFISIFFFFFYCFVDHRALHSFPTRRSSDLLAPIGVDLRPRLLVVIAGERPVGPLVAVGRHLAVHVEVVEQHPAVGDRKSTRLNSSHVAISYAVFCLKKKKKTTTQTESVTD